MLIMIGDKNEAGDISEDAQGVLVGKAFLPESLSLACHLLPPRDGWHRRT